MAAVFDREAYDKMDEATLRTGVLMPLLSAMGFKGVTENHGATELGKDIVCWREDAFGNRRNMAVVAKATQMKGKATTNKGAAGEISHQIRQCVGHEYPDPGTNEPQIVHDVWVVSNKTISPQARTAINAGVHADTRRDVTYCDGNELWALVEKHLLVSLWAQAHALSKHAESLSPYFRPRIDISGGQASISIEEKFPGAAKEQPIIFKTKIVGKEAVEAFQAKMQHYEETGETTEIPTELIHSIEIPEILQSIFGIKPDQYKSEQFKVSFVPPPFPKEFAARIRVICDDGEEYVQNYVVLRGVRVGTKEAVIESQQRETPFCLTIKLGIKGDAPAFNEASFNFKPRDMPINATQYWDLLRLHTCLSKPSRIQVESVEHSFGFFEGRLNTDFWEAPAPEYVAFYKRLAIIQQKTHVPLYVPERDLTNEEVEGINELYTIVTAGRTRATFNGLKTTVKPVKQFLNDLEHNFGEGKSETLVIEDEKTSYLFETAIPLGRARTTIDKVSLKNVEDVISRYDELVAPDGFTELEFIPAGEAKFVTEYFDWLPVDQKPPSMQPYPTSD